MDRASWVVLFLASDDAGLDPERLQKGLFLLSEQGVIPEDQRYRFEPSLDGPVAPDAFGDLRALSDGDVVAVRAVSGSRWREYTVTPAGRREAGVLAERIGGRAVDRVRAVREYVSGMPLRRLVDAVTREYPESRGVPARTA
ncbi:MAG: hypothetical protein HY658_13620 [Actinobacteria bacterium]|nr:hypothetical protein [Actinomycetota bacterium]